MTSVFHRECLRHLDVLLETALCYTFWARARFSFLNNQRTVLLGQRPDTRGRPRILSSSKALTDGNDLFWLLPPCLHFFVCMINWFLLLRSWRQLGVDHRVSCVVFYTSGFSTPPLITSSLYNWVSVLKVWYSFLFQSCVRDFQRSLFQKQWNRAEIRVL